MSNAMNEAPEQIWVQWPHVKGAGLAFTCQARPPALRKEYIRADLHATRIAELQALVSSSEAQRYRDCAALLNRAEAAEARLGDIATPTEPGSYVGDIWFGHPVKSTLGTHRWDGAEWQRMPSETECLLELLAASRAQVAKLVAAIRAAHDTLWELNPNNYTHDEVCQLNDASVEAILTLAPLIGETHGKTPEWWAERAALSAVKREPTEYERKVLQMKKDFPNGI